jgi:hypothetical protein
MMMYLDIEVEKVSRTLPQGLGEVGEQGQGQERSSHADQTDGTCQSDKYSLQSFLPL